MENRNYRNLTCKEIELLHARNCYAENWDAVMVSDDFDIRYVRNVEFSGNVRIGHFDKVFTLAGGIRKPCEDLRCWETEERKRKQ